MAKQLNVDMRFTADTAKAKQAITELQSAIQKLGYGLAPKDIVDPAQFAQASESARELAYHLNNAYNAKTGNLDLSKLNASLKQSGTDLSKLTANFKNAGAAGQQAFVSLANAIANADQPAITLNTHLSTMLTTIKNVARFQISSSLIHGFIGGIQKAYGYAQDLDQSLNNIRIVTGQSTEQMAKFAEQANKTARSLSATTLDYTDAALIYYQQGLNDEEVKARTDVTVKLANVSRQSAEEVSSQMTAIWNNFDDGAHSMEYFADVITALGATTASSSEEIAQGLQKFAPVAGTIGLSYEKATSVLAAIVANTRQSADTVGTGLRTIFSRFESLKLGETLEDGVDLNKYTKAMQTIGVNVLDANGKLRDMDSILDDVAANWEKLDNTQKTAFATTVGGVRQYTNLMALFENWDDVQTNMLTATGATGTLQKQADIYAESWEGARDRVKAATESLYSSLIDEKFFIGVDNVIEHILVGVSKFLDNFGGVKALFVSVLSFVASMVANKIGPAVKKVVQDIQIMSGGASKVYGQMQTSFTNLVNDELASGKYSTVASAELQSSSDLLLAKTKLGIVNDQLSAQEKMRYELAIQGMQLQASEIKKLAEEVVAAEKIKADATELVKKRQAELNELVEQELQKQKEVAKEKVASATEKVSTATNTKDLRAAQLSTADQAVAQAQISLINSSRASVYEISGQLSNVTAKLSAESQTVLTNFSSKVVEAANHVRNNLVTAIAEGADKTSAFGREINDILPKINQITPDNLEAITAELTLIQNVFKDVINTSSNKEGITAAFAGAKNALASGDFNNIRTAMEALRKEFLAAEQSSKSFVKSAQSLGQNDTKITAYTQAIRQQTQAKKNLEKADQALAAAEKELAEAEQESANLNENTIKDTPRLIAARKKHAEAVEAEAKAKDDYATATRKATKAESDLSAQASKFNPTHTLTAIEGITKTAAALGQTAMLINTVKSAIQTLGDESATTGEKMSAAFLAVSMGIPTLISLYGNFSTVLNGALNAMAAEGLLTDKSIAKHIANALSLDLVGAGYSKKTASAAAAVIADNAELFTTEALANSTSRINAILALNTVMHDKDAAAKIVDAIATGKLTTANIALKMSMIEIYAIIAAVIAVAVGLYKLFDWLIVTPKEAAESIETATESYNKAKEDVESLNNELETTKNRIQELQSQDSLTIVESQELAKLQSQNALLESQLAIKKEMAKIESKSLYKTFSGNFDIAMSDEVKKVQAAQQTVNSWKDYSENNHISTGIFKGRTDITSIDDYIAKYQEKLDDAKIDYQLSADNIAGFFSNGMHRTLYGSGRDTSPYNSEQEYVLKQLYEDYHNVLSTISDISDISRQEKIDPRHLENANQQLQTAINNAYTKLEEFTPQYLSLLEDYVDGVLDLTDQEFTDLVNNFAKTTKAAVGEDLYTANYLARANDQGGFNNITGADIASGNIKYSKDQLIDLARRNIGPEMYTEYLKGMQDELTAGGFSLDLVKLLNINELTTAADYMRANNTEAVNAILQAYNELNTAKTSLGELGNFNEQQIGTIEALIGKIDWTDMDSGFETLIEDLKLLGYNTDGAEDSLLAFVKAILGVKNAASGSKTSEPTLDTSEQAYKRYEEASEKFNHRYDTETKYNGSYRETKEKYTPEEIQQIETELIAARDAYLEAIETELNSEIKELGLDLDEVNDIIEYLGEHLDEAGIDNNADPLALKQIAKDILRARAAIDKATDSIDDWKDALNSKDIKDKSKAIGELREVYGDLLDVGKENITTGFAEDEENLQLLEDYINGDTEAYEKLREKAHETLTEDIEKDLKAKDEKSGENTLDNFQNKYAKVSDALKAIKFDALEAGADLENAFNNIDDPTIDNSSFLAALTEMVNAAGMTADQATAYLSSMGIDATVEQATETLPGETVGYNLTPVITHEGDDFAAGEGGTSRYEFPKVTYDVTPVQGEGKTVPVGALEVTSAKKSSGGNIKKSGGGGGSSGGGGGSSSKKDKPTPDRSSRYHRITKKQDNNSRALSKAADAKDRYAGKAKLDNLNKEIDLTKEAIELDKERLAEAQHWLEVDRKDLDDALKDVGLAAEIGPDNVIENYQQLFDDLLIQEQNLVDQYNKGLIDEDKYNEEKDKIDAAKDAMDNWEETIEEIQDTEDDLLDKTNEYFDLILSIASTKLELNLEVNDQDLELLEHLIDKLEDDAYKSAEAIALMGDKMGRELERANYYQNAINETLGAYGIYSMEQLANMSPEELQNLGITSDTINNLKDWNSELLNITETLDDLRDEIVNRVIDGFDTLQDKVQESYDYFSHWNTVLENYRDIVDLNMGALGGKQSRALIKQIDDSLLKNSTNALRSSKQMYDTLVESRTEAQKKLEEAMAAGRIGDIKHYEDVLADIDGKIKESQEQWLSDWSDGLQKAQDILTRAVEDAVAEYDKLLSPVYGSLDYLNEAYDRGKEVDEDYVQDYEKLYQLNKLNRDLTKVLNDTDGVKNREQLIKLQEKINKLQKDKTKMSEYDLEVLRKEFEVQQARIALEEAANAKSTVRLQRDNEGNWGYVYTSDFEATEELQQSYEDKLHEYQQLNDEYMSEMSDKLMELSQNARDRISEIWSDATLTQEEKEARIAEVMNWFNAQRNYIEEQMGHAIDNQAALTDRFYATYQNMQAEVRDTFAETVLSQTMNIEQLSEVTGLLTTGVASLVEAGRLASLEYLASMEEINEAAGTTMDELANNISSAVDQITIASDANVDTITELSETVQIELLNSLDAAIEAEEKFAQQIAETTANVEAQAAALADALRILNDYSGALSSSEIGNPLDTLSQSEEKYGIDQPVYNENDWLLNKELGEIFDAVYDEIKSDASHSDFLEMYGAMNDWLTLLQTQAGSAMQGFGSIMSPYYQTPESETLEQQVHIEANFPGVTNSSEIEEAFENLVNKAAQFANRKRQG